jgi:hypothetical protein
MNKHNTKQWIPEIVYEEGEGQLPFIHVPPDQKDPKLLFIFISRPTGEFEPGSEGEEVPVIEMDLRQFVDLSVLKAGLTEEEYDKCRALLGLESLRSASKKGAAITKNVRGNVGG